MKIEKRRCGLVMLCFICLVGCGSQKDTSISEASIETSAFFTEAEDAEQMREAPQIVKQGLCEQLEIKQEAKEKAEYNVWNRLCTGDEKNQQSLFCIDETTGVIYFVNQNKDWYLYRLKDGVAEVAVELPVKHVITWKGTVYFMIGSYNNQVSEELKEGDIFSYVPADGSVKRIYAMEEHGSRMHKLVAKEEGLFFSYAEKDKESQIYKTKYFWMPYGSTEVQEDSLRYSYTGWGDYFLISINPDGNKRLALISRTKFLEDIKELNVGRSGRACIVGDILYSTKGNGTSTEFAITNLVTGEQEIFDCWDVYASTKPGIVSKKEDIFFVFFESFVAVGDIIWAHHSSNIFKIDPANKTIKGYRINNLTYSLGDFYTDGDNLYAMYSEVADSRQQQLVRILTDQIGERTIEGLPTLEVEYILE